MISRKFEDWNKDKQLLDLQERINSPHPREIWSVKLGKNIGFEEDGKSGFLGPVIVIKKIGNLYFTIPLTTKGKSDSPFYHHIESIDFGKPSAIILSQARVLDAKRFILKINKISAPEFQEIKYTLGRMYL